MKKLKGAVVSVVVPLQYITSHAAVTRLAFACAMITLQRPPVARERVLFMIDECAALGTMRALPENWIPTMRKYRAWIWPVFQDISQIKHLYGALWPTFEGNAGMRQYLGTRDYETADHISKMCGRTTVQDNKMLFGRQLITPEEVMQMPQDQQIVMIENLAPARLKVRPFWQRPGLMGRFFKNPFYTSMPRIHQGWPLQALLSVPLGVISDVISSRLALAGIAVAAFVYLGDPQILIGQDRGTCIYATWKGERRARLWSCPGLIIKGEPVR